MCGEDALDLSEGVWVDESGMLALVLDTAPGDESQVIAIAQDGVQLIVGQRPRRPAGSRPLRQSPLTEFVGESANRVVACGVGIKGPAHQRCPLGIERDAARLPAIDNLADIQVAERRNMGGAASGHLLLSPLDDLVREVSRVELRDRAHDAMQQEPTRRLINVLRDRDEPRPGGLQLGRDHGVVVTVTRQPVHFVHDDEVDGLLGDELQEALETRTIGRARTLACIDEFLYNGGSELLCLAQACLSLCWD